MMKWLICVGLLPACADPIEEPAQAKPTVIDASSCAEPDCPYITPALIFGMSVDANHGPDVPVAANGRYRYTYSVYHADPREYETTMVSDAFLAKADGDLHVVAQAGPHQGSGTLVVTTHGRYRDLELVRSSRKTTAVLPIANVRIDLPRYRPLDSANGVAPIFVGSSFTGAVRLVAADGRFLADDSLTTSGPHAKMLRWDAFELAAPEVGRHWVTVQGASLVQPVTLPFDVTDHIDEIRLTDYRYPPPSYYHRVCAHAFNGGAEVYSEWQVIVTGKPSLHEEYGNCIDVSMGTSGTATATFTGADGSTQQIVVSATGA